MRALVLSGGAVKGAWEVGILCYLMGSLGRQYQIVAGVSIGALNALHLAQESPDNPEKAVHRLKRAWLDLKPHHVYKSWPVWGRLASLWKPSAYDSSVLPETLKQLVNMEDVRNSGTKICVGATNLSTGQYEIFREYHANLLNMVVASAAVPGVLLPVEHNGALWGDGGVRNMTPLGAAIHTGATEVDILITSPKGKFPPLPKKPNALNMASRAIEIMLDEIIEGDLQTCQHVNKLVQHGISRAGQRKVDVKVFRPHDVLVADSFAFERNTVSKLIKQGYSDARQIAES